MSRSQHSFTLTEERVTKFDVYCNICSSSYTSLDNTHIGDWMVTHTHHIQSCCNCDSAEERAGNEEVCCGCNCHDSVKQKGYNSEAVDYPKFLP